MEKKHDFLKKLSNLELWCLLTTYRKLCKLNWAFQRIHYWIPIIQDGWDLRHDVIFCREWSDLDKISQTGTEWHVDCGHCGDVWKRQPDVQFQYGGRLGEFNGMSSQSHVSHCRVLQWWWMHCHDSRATCPIAGCSHLAKSMSWSCHIAGRIPSAILKIVFRHIFFVFNAV